jgi:GGDEF domain-containing protein
MERLRRLDYREIERKPTVSIGVCVVEADSHLTDSEAQERANRAKKFAKDQGKNRIAAFGSDLFRDEDLYIAAVGPPAE